MALLSGGGSTVSIGDARGSTPLAGLRVLIADDEATDRARYAGWLAQAGAEVTAAATLSRARRALARRRFDAAVIGRVLGDGDGFTHLVEPALRESKRAHPAFVVASRHFTPDGYDAVDATAAIAVPKEWLKAPQVLVECVLGAIRRCTEAEGRRRKKRRRQANVLPRIGSWRVDLVAARLVGARGVARLSQAEVRMLAWFLRHRGRSFSTRTLARDVYARSDDAGLGFVRQVVGKLRAKLGEDARRLENVLGRGYRLAR